MRFILLLFLLASAAKPAHGLSIINNRIQLASCPQTDTLVVKDILKPSYQDATGIIISGAACALVGTAAIAYAYLGSGMAPLLFAILGIVVAFVGGVLLGVGVIMCLVTYLVYRSRLKRARRGYKSVMKRAAKMYQYRLAAREWDWSIIFDIDLFFCV